MASLRPGLGVLAFVFILVLDQMTKALVLARLDPGAPIALTPFFNLVLVWNEGVSFGMLSGHGQPLLLVGAAAVICVLLVLWLRRERRTRPRVALWLVLAGAIGNVIDRLRFGAVVDFLDVHAAGWHWPAFNVADAAICVGAAVLVLDSLLVPRPGLDERAGKA